MKNTTTLLILLSLTFAFGCSKKSSIPVDHNEEALLTNEEFFLHPEEVTLYNSWQPKADKIKKCAFINKAENSCPISDSPLIGIGKEQITVEDVLNKTMSSKPAYIETFRHVLNTMPRETLVMFGSVNAIVISERITPSFYTFKSGAIYLSASYFWKTPEEKAVATPHRDYRENFGNTLQFSDSSDYIKNSKSLYSSARQKYRSNDELAPEMIRLIFHELAHANDFFPKSFYNSKEMDTAKTYYDITDKRWDQNLIISQNLKTTLKSEVLLRMGDVLFQGETATQKDLDTSAHVIVDEFKNDGAADLYAYSTPREDLAMLVEKSLMYHYFGYSAFTVFIKYPSANFTIPESFDYPIAGGIKDKIADQKVKERAQAVIESIYDYNFSQRVIGSLDQIRAIDIPENTSWDKLDYL